MSARSRTIWTDVRLRAGETSTRIWILNVLIAATAIGLYAGPLAALKPAPPAIGLPWWVLAAGFYVADLLVVHVRIRNEAHTFSTSELVVVVGLFMATPRDLVLAQLVGAAGALVLNRRQVPIKLAFNLGQYSLAAVLSVLVFTVMRGSARPDDLHAWGAAVVAVMVYSLVSHLLTATVISLSERTGSVGRFVETTILGLLGALTSASLALLAVTLLNEDAPALLLLLLPVGIFVVSYRTYVGERRKQANMSLLYESSRLLQQSAELESSVLIVVSHARRMFRSELAEVVLFGESDPAECVRSVLGPGEHAELSRLVTDPEQLAFFQWIASEEGARAVDPAASEWAILKARGLSAAMAVPLRGEKRVVGAMLVANRAGSTVGFKSEDLRLLETFAGQASVALEKGQLSKQLVHQAFHDALTGLANRALLVDRVDHALKRRGAGLLALLFIDLDDFKTINDSLGHEAGDQLLIAVGERLTSCLRPADTAARLGGDEFAILLEDLDAPGAQLVTQRIEEAMERPLRVGADEISASASIGLAIWDGQPTTADELLSQADLAMYRAKRAGATDHVVFEASMKLEVVERLALKADIERAVERAEFTLHYQPIVDLASGRLTSLEALVRWPHAKRGMVGPDLFIPLAEETGLIIPLGTFVLREACRRLREWHLSHPRLRKVAVNVNVSMRQLADPTFVDDVLEILTSTEVDPHCVILEITERLILETTPEILEGLERLRAVGVRLAIDDFGTGYSSLSSLRGFPVDVVKLAKDFIDTIENDASSRAYAAAIIKLGQVLGLQTLAEGIETPAQAEVLRKQGCELGQGWHFGRPAPMESIETLLASQEATLLPA